MNDYQPIKRAETQLTRALCDIGMLLDLPIILHGPRQAGVLLEVYEGIGPRYDGYRRIIP